MKLKLTISFALFTLIALYSAQYNPLHSRKNQPPLKTTTGAPTNSSCGVSNCHNTTTNMGSGTISFSLPGGASTYIPGNTYTISVGVTEMGKSIWGFEAVALDATNNEQAGSFNTANNMADATLSIQNDAGTTPITEYVGHNSASTATATWNVEWQAPATDVGDVTFYFAGIAGNDNNASSGDNLYSGSLTISPEPSSIGNILPEHISVYPNPATFEVNVNSTAEVVYELYDLNGQLIFNSTNRLHEKIDVTKLANGVYLMHLNDNQNKYVQKIVVAN